MKKQTTILLLLMIASAGFGQISFKSGYLITTNNQRINGLFRDQNWLNSPKVIEYAYSQGETTHKVSTDTIRELVIGDNTKYIRAKVKIDRSTSDLTALDVNRNPVFSEEHLFLKVITEGKATLYQYNEPNLERYFFKVDSSGINQLVYKLYWVRQSVMATNNQYKQQLLNAMHSDDLNQNDLKYLTYDLAKLTKYFKKYNQQNESNIPEEVVNKKTQHDWINITLKPGISYGHAVLWYYRLFPDPVKLNNKTTFRIGLDLEMPFKFNEKRWSIFIEPGFQRYKASGQSVVHELSVDYQSIELPAGLRYRYYFSNGTAVFFDAAVIFDFDFNSTITYSESYEPLEVYSLINYGIGAGFQFNKWLSAGMRFQTPRDLTVNYSYWHGDYYHMSFYVGFKLL